MLCTGCWVPVGRHDPCRRCKSVHTVTRRDEVITPYGSRPDTQGNNHNRPAAHCYARQITGAQSCGKKKKESADLQSTLSSFLAANATLSGAKESWGVARGDRKPWCPVPFCPPPPGGGTSPHAAACKPRLPIGSIPPPPGGGTSPHAAACKPRLPGGSIPSPPASRPQERRKRFHSTSERLGAGERLSRGASCRGSPAG